MGGGRSGRWAWTVGATPALPPQVVEAHAGARRFVVLIGPEGGWNDYELDWIERRGFEYASLGERILRTDTAVIVALGAMRMRLAHPGAGPAGAPAAAAGGPVRRWLGLFGRWGARR